MILDLIIKSSFPALCIFLWYKTNFFYEYVKLFKFNKFKIFKEYEDFIQHSHIYFPIFLGFKNNFFAKLLNCPMCLNFWLTILFCLLFKISLYYFPLFYIISLGQYLLLCIILSIYEKN